MRLRELAAAQRARNRLLALIALLLVVVAGLMYFRPM